MIFQAAERDISYFKRFRMEIDLQRPLLPVPALPEGYEWVAWEERLLEQHADVKFRCFSDELDAVVFPNLGNREGCRRLMREITGRPGFKPEATWLIVHDGDYCATIQGVRDWSGAGAIQNVGVTPSHRGLGLATALLLKSLHGFQRCGAHRVNLEVTARNESAIRIYRRVGFRCRKTLYKAVAAATPAHDWIL